MNDLIGDSYSRTSGNLRHFTLETLPHFCSVRNREVLKGECLKLRSDPSNKILICDKPGCICTPLWLKCGGNGPNPKIEAEAQRFRESGKVGVETKTSIPTPKAERTKKAAEAEAESKTSVPEDEEAEGVDGTEVIESVEEDEAVADAALRDIAADGAGETKTPAPAPDDGGAEKDNEAGDETRAPIPTPEIGEVKKVRVKKTEELIDVPSLLLQKMIVQLLVSEVYPDPNQPREEFNEEDIDELGDSILEIGQLVPVVVRDLGDNYFKIVDGERRWRACKKKHIKYIYALFADDLEKLGIDPFEVSVIINFGRVGHTPKEITRAILEMIKIAEKRDAKKTREEIYGSIARKFCRKSTQWVVNYLSLSKLPPKVQGLVSSHSKTGFPLLVAFDLARLKSQEVQSKLADRIIKTGMSAKAARQLVRAKIEEEGGRTRKDKRTPRDDYRILRTFAYNALDSLNIILGWGPEKIIMLFFNRDGKDRTRSLERLDRIMKKLQKLRETIHNEGSIRSELKESVKKLWETDKTGGQGGEIEEE